MKEGIKLELYRAFHNRAYYVALIIACIIAVAQVVMDVLPLSNENKIPSVSNVDFIIRLHV